MSREPRDWQEQDDGRTIADMSDFGRPSVLSGFTGRRRKPDAPQPVQESRPWDTGGQLSGREKLWVIWGALKASLLVGCAYAFGLGLVILLMLYFWT